LTKLGHGRLLVVADDVIDWTVEQAAEEEVAAGRCVVSPL
jgi:hypothetical protein